MIMGMDVFLAITVFVVSFLLGSIPWGVVISKIFYHTDIREHGSGNIGTTNAMRAMGRKGGVIVFLLDFGKGLISGFVAFCAWWILQSYDGLPGEAMNLFLPGFLGLAFLGCIWGHIFSPWLKFHGGKGIAVAVGAEFFVFFFWGAIIELALFTVLVLATRYVSVGSLAAAIACPFLAAFYFLVGSWSPLAFCCCTLAALTVIWAHRGNISRLIHHEERRIGSKAKS